ncbi:hypothetical protein M9H77_24001 [Catharanthus roseus]|uniref:Uncharacterized protein n=1 Tax=Catharanthus roseus TaxID=4058 RepID=A0ACC0AUL1_CATRO|nr:hypothetical protein M9H77_24001 [Catharanthus roseus]
MKISRAGLGTGKCRNSGKAGHNKRMCQGSSKTVRQSNATEEPNVSPQAEVEMPTHNTQVSNVSKKQTRCGICREAGHIKITCTIEAKATPYGSTPAGA